MDSFQLLILEDSASDAEMIVKTLQEAGMDYEHVWVETRSEFLKAIGDAPFDVVLADNHLPDFTAKEALEMMRQNAIHTPFILVTGTMTDEYAVEMMKEGVWDYVIKDRMQRLPGAIASCLEKRQLVQERNKYMREIVAKEAAFIEAARLARFGSWEINYEDYSEYWSDEHFRILGYRPGEVTPSFDTLLERIHPDDTARVKEVIDNAIHHSKRQKFDCRIVHRDGTTKYIAGEMKPVVSEGGRLLRVNGFIQDVTAAREAQITEKKITDDLLRRNKDLEQFAYIISHNLRRPVANIRGIVNVLAEHDDMPADEREYFVDALAGSTQMLDTVIVDLHKILDVSQNVNEMKEQVNFDLLVREVRVGLESQIEQKKTLITCDFSAMKGMFTLKSYLYSIFHNLISNSIKFRKPDTAPEIEITSFSHDKDFGLVFKDNGIGIDTVQHSGKIFGLYRRFHPDYAEGRGFGLYMVKTQVETLGGAIQVKSQPGEGTEFTITFPHSAN